MIVKILVVDDDGAIRDVTTRILKSEGYQVDQASSLHDARELVMQTEYALVITDMKMPDGDGIETIRVFKKLRPQLDIIILTGYGTLDSAIDSMRAGAADFLLKPCSGKQLRDTVKKTIVKREVSQENRMLRALNDMKDKFLTLVSHELRTPLTLIYGYLSIFQRQGANLTREQGELINIVVKATRKLINIVNNIQTLTQAVGGDMRLHLQKILPRKLLSDVISEMKTSVPDRNLNMSIQDGEEIEAICGDSIRLRQAIMELIQNAIRNTPDGGEIIVGAVKKDNRVLLWVKDSGIGIPLAEQGKIFEPFYEVADVEKHTSSASRFQGGGIGLGLSLVKAVVEAHHGSIRLEAEPNHGTMFEISLPMDLQIPPDDISSRIHNFSTSNPLDLD